MMKPSSRGSKTAGTVITAAFACMLAVLAAVSLVGGIPSFSGIESNGDLSDLPVSTMSAPPPAPDLTAEAKVCMAGDIMLHKGPVASAKTGERSYDFTPYMEEIRPYVDGGLNISGIEGSVDAYGDNKNITSYPRFNYPIELIGAIKFLGFNTIVTANNHAYDQGWSGLLATKDKFAAAGMDAVGTYRSQEEYDTVTIKEINGIKIGITAWSALDNGMSGIIPKENLPYSMRLFNQDKLDDVPRMLAEVEKLRRQGAEVVLMPLHWGAEYNDSPTSNQREIAGRLLAGGVDILIGNHTHCVQPIEIRTVQRNGREQTALCIYSLGNFFADQLGISPPTPKTQYGMLVSAVISRDKDGFIDLTAMRYMPTVCYRDALRKVHKNDSAYGYAFLPAGKYAGMTVKPSDLSSNVWNEAKKAWEHVRKVAGTAIEAYDGN